MLVHFQPGNDDDPIGDKDGKVVNQFKADGKTNHNWTRLKVDIDRQKETVLQVVNG